MTSLFHFKVKVHRRNLTRAKSLLLLIPRLLCQVLEHLGFPAEPRLECHRDYEAILTVDKWRLLPGTQHLPPQDLAEDQPADAHATVDQPPPTGHTEEPQIAPSIAPPVTAPLQTAPASFVPLLPPALAHSFGPSTLEPPLQHVSISTQDFLAIMGAVRTFSATSTSAAHTTLVERMTRAEAALV